MDGGLGGWMRGIFCVLSVGQQALAMRCEAMQCKAGNARLGVCPFRWTFSMALERDMCLYVVRILASGYMWFRVLVEFTSLVLF
jgi:hypothetical protein